MDIILREENRKIKNNPADVLNKKKCILKQLNYCVVHLYKERFHNEQTAQ